MIAGSHYEGSGGSDADASGGGFYAWNSQLQGAWDVVSAGYCGIYDSYVLDPVTFKSSNALFYCNGGFFPNTGGSSPRPYIKVDGTPAYAPSG